MILRTAHRGGPHGSHRQTLCREDPIPYCLDKSTDMTINIVVNVGLMLLGAKLPVLEVCLMLAAMRSMLRPTEHSGWITCMSLAEC